MIAVILRVKCITLYVLEVTVCADKSDPSFASFDIKIFYLFNSE